MQDAKRSSRTPSTISARARWNSSKNMKPNDHLRLKLRPACLPPPPLHSGTVRVLGQCHLCLLIQVVFPVILSFRCEHLQLFTVKCPLCSPSLPVCFQHYPLRAVHTVWFHRAAAFSWREVIGRVTQEVIVSREKINADWSRRDSLSGARATEAPAKASFFKWERGLFNSCISSQAGRQWRGKRDKRKQMQNRETF